MLNVSNVGNVTTEHGSLFQYTTAAGKRIFVKVHRCVNLTQCKGVAMSCHSGGLFKICSHIALIILSVFSFYTFVSMQTDCKKIPNDVL